MRLTRLLILTLLTLPLLGTGMLKAQQDTHKGPGNSSAYLTREVRHELVQVPWYSVFDILQYSVKGNEVTLFGAVTQPTVKSDAENAVKHIEGVDKVNNQIEVLPPSPMDDEIRRANL